MVMEDCKLRRDTGGSDGGVRDGDADGDFKLCKNELYSFIFNLSVVFCTSRVFSCSAFFPLTNLLIPLIRLHCAGLIEIFSRLE